MQEYVYEEQAMRFLEVAAKHYEDNKKKWMKYFNDSDFDFDEDVFSDSIIKVHKYLLTHKLEDDSDNGLLNYWFKSFQINSKREKQYAHNQYTVYGLNLAEESDSRPNFEETKDDKVRRHIYDDWVATYILQQIEEKFDDVTFRCFRLYYIIPKMTYARLKEVTNVSDCKKRVTEVKKWVKTNITISHLNDEFRKYYGD